MSKTATINFKDVSYCKTYGLYLCMSLCGEGGGGGGCL